MKKLFIAAAVSFASMTSMAQMYGEAAYLSTTIKDGSAKVSPSGVRSIVGYELNPNLAFEGMITIGSGASTVTGTVSGHEAKIISMAGLYVKPKIKLYDSFEIFARIGSTRNTVDSNLTSPSTLTGLSYGLGLGYAINATTSLNFDYMQYHNKSSVIINGHTFGIGLKF